jgi:hypothetical protein
VDCIDWLPLFNSVLITKDYSGMSASDIARDVVEQTNGFLPYGIEDGLPTLDDCVATNETPASLLARVALEIGGGIRVDARRVVHVWGSSGPTLAIAPTPPRTLTETVGPLLESFDFEEDGSQRRTKVVCEGHTAILRETIPAGADPATYGIPIDHDGQWFFSPDADTDGEATFARIGTLIVNYTNTHNVIGPPFAFVTTTPASAGDTVVTFNGASAEFTTQGAGGEIWVYEPGGSYFAALGVGTAGSDQTLTNIPASGYGSLKVDLPVGTPLYRTGHLAGVVVTSTDVPEVKEGDPVVVRAEVEDSAAQAALAAQSGISGDDGVRTHFVSDPDLKALGCKARAQAELDVFADDPLPRATWVTYDMNAVPGAQQVINFGAPDTISETLMIDRVVVTFPRKHGPPRRVCQGSTVKLETVLEAIKG